jgi:hypothetical protein
VLIALEAENTGRRTWEKAGNAECEVAVDLAYR